MRLKSRPLSSFVAEVGFELCSQKPIGAPAVTRASIVGGGGGGGGGAVTSPSAGAMIGWVTRHVTCRGSRSCRHWRIGDAYRRLRDFSTWKLGQVGRRKRFFFLNCFFKFSQRQGHSMCSENDHEICSDRTNWPLDEKCTRLVGGRPCFSMVTAYFICQIRVRGNKVDITISERYHSPEKMTDEGDIRKERRRTGPVGRPYWCATFWFVLLFFYCAFLFLTFVASRIGFALEICWTKIPVRSLIELSGSLGMASPFF